MSHKDIKTIIVPVARPDSAIQMLKLAHAMINVEKGRIIALTIALSDSEQIHTVNKEITPVIEELQEQDLPVELLTEISTSISRGILDAIREHNADILIMGVNQPDRQQVKLGTVVENVIQTAPCDVVIYRLSQFSNIGRVIVPIDGDSHDTVALQLGVSLAKNLDVKLQAAYMLHKYRLVPKNEMAIRQVLLTMPDDKLEKTFFSSEKPADEVLETVGAGDILALGFTHRDDFERTMDETSHKFVNRCPSPVLLISRMETDDSIQGRFQQRLAEISPTLTTVEKNELVWQAQKMSHPNLDYSMMILLSAGLASLGLLLSSPAVIIGAMLVAPLMQPLAALSIGLATLRPISRRAALTLLQGMLLALLISMLAGLFPPIDLPTPEMSARGNPTFLDAFVALVSGFVAAYATARKGIPAALAGVAIAAALMPPVCTIGLGIASENIDLAVGATLLFLTNIVFIVIAQYVMFLWLGLRPKREDGKISWVTTSTVMLATLIIIFIFFSIRLRQQATEGLDIERRLTERFAPAEVVQLEVLNTNDPIDIAITLRSNSVVTPKFVSTVQEELSAELEQDVLLEVVVLQTIRPFDADREVVQQILSTNLPEAQISEFSIIRDEPMRIEVLLTSETEISQETAQMLRDQLGEQLGHNNLLLEIALDRVIRIEVAEQSAETEETTTEEQN